MDRREFLKIIGTAAAASALGLRGVERVFAAEALPDLVAVRNGEPAALVDAALAGLGGMGRFVTKGQTVVVKPNMGWAVAPENGANTNPATIKRIVEHCLNAGAKKVYVFDNSCDSWRMSYSTSGIEKAARDAGAEVVPANVEGLYHKVELKGAVTLRNVKVHELILESDVFINVPVLKNHGGAGMTAALKNYMGLVWDRGYFHLNNLDACIAEASLVRKADLTILDMYRVMKSGGPRGNPSSNMALLKTIAASTDPVAIDASAAKTLGFEPSKFGYISRAAKLGLGTDKLETLDIKRIVL
jgi:uncharacterized protein (DUF362 family)